MVEYIMAAQSLKNLHFILGAQYSNNTNAVFTVDLSQVFSRNCEGEWDVTMPESDYEFWTPKVEKCSLGR